MKPLLLITIAFSDRHLDLVRPHFEVLHAPSAELRSQAIQQHGPQIRAVLTNGATGLTPSEMDAMATLSIVCAFGAGYENIAVDHARQRGIVVANGANTNADCVADHAFALLLAVVRGIPKLDKICREGGWRDQLPWQPNFSGKRLGILGYGSIGALLAERGAGFKLEIGYHNRRPRPDVSHAYFDSALSLAEWADYLVVATPGGGGTRHLVDTQVLKALGPAGVLVNIARGSVVDTDALAQALREGWVAGAGLDVYESEPAPPLQLLDLPNVVLTPHIAGWSPEALDASAQRFVENATRHFAGQAPVTPV